MPQAAASDAALSSTAIADLVCGAVKAAQKSFEDNPDMQGVVSERLKLGTNGRSMLQKAIETLVLERR